MALTKEKKVEQVERLAKELEGSTSAIVGSFAKLTVTQDFELRKVVRGAGGSYRVVKNKLAALASKGTQVEGALQGLKGVSSVAYTSGDPVALAKALSTWVADNSEFTFKLGIIDGKVISVDEIKQLATMPAKEEIYAKLLFLISSPAQRLVTVLNAAGRDMAVVLGQGVEKEKFAAGAAPVAAPVVAAPALAEAPVAEAPKVEASAVATVAPVAQAPVAEAPEAVAGEPVAEAATPDVATSDATVPEATDTDGALVGLSQTEASVSLDPVEGKVEDAAPVDGAAETPAE
ncbi:MAG TPA: 50S ribosomal protein L10 [Acidisarcina sp.]